MFTVSCGFTSAVLPAASAVRTTREPAAIFERLTSKPKSGPRPTSRKVFPSSLASTSATAPASSTRPTMVTRPFTSSSGRGAEDREDRRGDILAEGHLGHRGVARGVDGPDREEVRALVLRHQRDEHGEPSSVAGRAGLAAG